MGFFFLLMAIGANGSFTFTNPQAYGEFVNDALIPVYREIALTAVELNPVLFGLLLMLYEITKGLLLLHNRIVVKIGLIGTMIFLFGIWPLSYLQIPWLGLIIGEIYLLTKEFETTFFESVQLKLRRR